MADSDEIVVAVDFGTTFSAVAFSYKSPDDIEVIKTWPDSKGLTSDKVPTEFSYDMQPILGKRKRSHDHSDTLIDIITSTPSGLKTIKPIRMGYELSPDERRVVCIKLFLERKQALPGFVDVLRNLEDLRKHDRSIDDAVADFLARIRSHTMEHLRKRFGDEFVASTPVQFVLTVPAIWSDIAKDATLRAATQAGMGPKFMLISEPEAAAVYALRAIQANGLQVGDNIVICDAGGGTVDLISYGIASLEPLSLKECAVGTGGLCGAAFLNARFQLHIKSRLGEEEFEKMRLTKPKTWQTALNTFEDYIKRNFDGNVNKDFNIPFPGLSDNKQAGIDGGFLLLTPDQVEDIFSTVVAAVISLVQDQVESIILNMEAVKAIVLVGGFGQSSYLYNRLKSRFSADHILFDRQQPSERSHEDERAKPLIFKKAIQVMQPINAWTAVVRGAVLRGLEGSIISERRSRYHYGTIGDSVFDAAKHTPDQRYFDKLAEVYRASSCTCWYVAKGENVSENRAITIKFVEDRSGRSFFKGHSRTASYNLYASSNDVAPSHYNDQLVLVCKLVVDLSEIPNTALEKRKTSKGKCFLRLSFELEMKIDSATLEFGMKVNGKSCGSVEASFNHEVI